MPNSPIPGSALRFGLFEFDPKSLELTRSGRKVRIQPQPAKVLGYLAAQSGELILREDLQRHIWGDTFVDSEAGLNACIRDIRAALGDPASAPAYVETVPRRGYRFIAPVATIGSHDPAPRARTPRPARALPATALMVILVAVSVGVWGLGAMSSQPNSYATTQPPPGVDPKAYEAVLEAHYLLDRGHNGDADRAAEKAQSATRLEPTWGDAWLTLGNARLAQPMPPREAMPAARAAFAQALAYDPTLAEAHIGLARVHQGFDWDLRAAARDLERARRIGGDTSELHQSYAWLYLVSNQPEKALEHLHEALRLDPVVARIRGDIGWVYAMLGDYEEAIHQCQKGLELEPDTGWLHGCLVEVYRAQGRLGEAVDSARREMKARSATETELARLASEEPQAVLAALDDWRLERLLEQRNERFVPSCAIGIRHAQAGNHDEALRHLEAAYDERSGFMPFLEMSDALRPLHNEPRFQELVLRMRSEMGSEQVAATQEPG